MKRYKLLKDLPGIKAGTVFRTGNQVYNELYDDNNGRATGYRLLPNGDISGEVPLLCSPVNEWLEEIPEEYKRWRAELHETYYYLDDDGEIAVDEEAGFHSENSHYLFGNYFKTEGEAQKAANWLKAFAVLRDDTKGFKPNWMATGQTKWCVFYDHASKELGVDWRGVQEDGCIYFATREDARSSIESHKQEWLTFFGVEE